jgi:hypothetical protein
MGFSLADFKRCIAALKDVTASNFKHLNHLNGMRPPVDAELAA